MTSSKSLKRSKEYKRGNSFQYLLKETLRNNWWIAAMCSILAFLAGPIATLLFVESTRDGDFGATTEDALYAVSNWFSSGGGITLFYIMAVLFAVVISCIMFAYLHNKKQIQFYHSQPVKRNRLFFVNYISGIILGFLPIILMLVLSLLIISFYGFGEVVRPVVVFCQLLYMLAFFMSSYAIGVFANQLTGTILTSIAMNGFLHFAVPLTAVVLNLLKSTFYATVVGSGNLSYYLHYSPTCALVGYLSRAEYRMNAEMFLTPMSNDMLVILLAMALILTVGAVILYGKRPSEQTGKAFIYPVLQPVIKALLMFLIACLGGFFLFEIGGKRIFFYMGIILAGVITHMICEVVFQHDFKAMKSKLGHCGIILVLILGIIGFFRVDLFHYDDYLPKPDEVKSVLLSIDNKEHGVASADQSVAEDVYTLLEPVVEGKLYRESIFDNKEEIDEEQEDQTVDLNVEYHLENGKVEKRRYDNVPMVQIENRFQKLYNNKAYRMSCYGRLMRLSSKQVTNLYVPDMGRQITNPKQIDVFLKAYQRDLMDRRFADLRLPIKANVSFNATEKATRQFGFLTEFPVLVTDERTMKYLEKWKMIEKNESYDELLIFRTEKSTQVELRNLISEELTKRGSDMSWESLSAEEYISILKGKAELTGKLQGAEEVGAFIDETSLLGEKNQFTNYDYTHIALLRMNMNDVNGELWEVHLFYSNTIPEQYQ